MMNVEVCERACRLPEFLRNEVQQEIGAGGKRWQADAKKKQRAEVYSYGLV